MSPDLHHLSGAYALDALDDVERALFEQHLAGCADCRNEVAELSATAHSLAALTEEPPPPALRAAVLSGIRQVRPLPPLADDHDGMPAANLAATERHPESTVEPQASGEGDGDSVGDGGGAEGMGTVIPLRRRAWTWVAAAAAAAVIAVGGLVWSPWSDPAEPSPLAQVVAAEDAMRVSRTQGALTAELAYSRQLGQAAVSVSGLPPAPEGKTYQLWYVGSDEVARSAGLLTTGSDGRGELLLQGDANSAAAVGMTLEPAGGSSQPTTEPLVVLALA